MRCELLIGWAPMSAPSLSSLVRLGGVELPPESASVDSSAALYAGTGFLGVFLGPLPALDSERESAAPASGTGEGEASGVALVGVTVVGIDWMVERRDSRVLSIPRGYALLICEGPRNAGGSGDTVVERPVLALPDRLMPPTYFSSMLSASSSRTAAAA